MNVFGELEARLKPNRAGAMRKMTERVLGLEKLRLWFVGLSVVGALLIALSKAFSGTEGAVLIVGGALVAAVGAAFTARFDFRKLELTSLLADAEAIAEEAIVAGREADQRQQADNANAAQLDAKRRALLEMQANVHTGCLNCPLGEPIERVAQLIMNLASAELVDAIGFERGERWAFSLFRAIGADDDVVLRRVAVHWADRHREGVDGRVWKPREGVTGWAWHDRGEVILSDIYDVEHGAKYMAHGDSRRDDDRDRYVSAAAIPIRLGKGAGIWGILTATSSHRGRFMRNPQDASSQNVETVRCLARLFAGQIAIRQIANGH